MTSEGNNSTEGWGFSALGAGIARLTAGLAFAALLLFAPAAHGQYYDQSNQQNDGYQGGQQQLSSRERTCFDLEQELANDWARGGDSQSEISRIQQDISKYNRIFQNSRSELNRTGCYESAFIFGRSLLRTPRCLQLNNRMEEASHHLTRLQEQRNYMNRGRNSQRRKNELIASLARNGCGDQYRRESRRRSGFFSWFGGDDFFAPRRDLETSRIVPYATYRTLCVRLCDGYYFPISYSTLPSRFSQDAGKCQSQCAAPAELFVYRNPGEEPEQMVSVQGKAYNELPSAWRYRKEYVKGCSCKSAEYSPNDIEPAKKETDAGPGVGGTAQIAGENEPRAQRPRP